MSQELFIVLLTGSWHNSGDLKREEAREVAGLSTERLHGPLFKLDLQKQGKLTEVVLQSELQKEIDLWSRAGSFPKFAYFFLMISKLTFLF